jgi:hypothetical protein
LPQGDERYDIIDRLLEAARGKGTLTTSVLIDDEYHRVDWPIDFSDYQVTRRPRPSPQRLFRSEGYVDPEAIELIGKYLHACDFDTLTYYTIGPGEYLQNTQDRNDWFFYIDYFHDSDRTSPEEADAAVRDMIAWTYDRSHRSRIQWVNNANAMLRQILAELEKDGVDTTAIVENTRYYYEGLFRESDAGMTLQGYLENRRKSCGMYPEVEYCFAYTGRRLQPEERGRAHMMKECAAAIIGLQNDTCSLWKERNEPGHISLRSYCQTPRQFLTLVTSTYQAQLESFHRIKPEPSDVALAEYWDVCNRWICGSLLWHITTRRYNRGNIILPR